MISTKDALKQTCKTILFEKFSDDAENLKTILDLYDDPTLIGKDELEKLEVHSFEEFMVKFKPKIYESCQLVGGLPAFTYTCDADEAKSRNAIEKDIEDNVFFRMLMKMYSTKGNSGLSNIDFDDSEFLNMLTPNQEKKDALNTRKLLRSATERFIEAKDRGENADDFAVKIVECRQKIIQKYENSVIHLLPIALADIDTKLNFLNTYTEQIGKQGDAVVETGDLLISGHMEFDDYGNLTVVKNPEPDIISGGMPQIDSGKKIDLLLTQTLEKDYDKNKHGSENNFVKSLILDTYAPNHSNSMPECLPAEVEEKRAELVQRKSVYESVFVNSKNSFIRALAEICTKLLSVKIFFDHATVNGNLDAGLLVTNCEASDLLSEKFEEFIKHRGKDQISKRYWFAIIPGVKDTNKIIPTPSPLDPFGELQPDSTSTKSNNICELDISTVKKLLDILNEAKIMSVFSFKGNKNNSFDRMSVGYLNDVKGKLSNFNNPHAVFAYPNFTVLREREVKVAESTGVDKVLVPAIYIDACHVAAGLLVGSQQVNYLESKGFKVINGNVCVRVDLEANQTKLLTKFNREQEKNWTSEVLKEINNDMFGFALCGNELMSDGKVIENTYVYCARTLSKRGDSYCPIYKVLMENFLSAYLQLSGLKVSTIKKFIRNEVGDWKDMIQLKSSKDCVNLILRENEDIIFNEEQKQVYVSFNGDERCLNDIKVISD